MAAIEELEIPDFLSVNDEDDIQDEILGLVPDEYDKSEGQHYYNFTRPTARIVSEMRGFDIPNALALIWPKFSNGEYMDYHAEIRNMIRKEAQYATGTITFTGTPETVIPAGYMCSTESRNDIASRDYITLEECTIGEDGTVTVTAQASVAGSEGNTAANTIIINSTAFDDVTGVTNDIAFTGGIDEESDEDLLGRIQDYDSLQGDSNVGNPSDYKRWAESVPGTGHATVIRPTDTSGLVTIILTDGNGEPANETLCNAVYDYIMSPDDDSQRLAPCNAILSVLPPETMVVVISGSIELTSGTVSGIKQLYVDRLNEYFQEAISDKEIRYQKICNILGSIEGVYDYNGITLNGGTENIELESGVFPITDASNISLILVE